MRFRDLVQDINRHEQKIENVLLYVDFMDHELPVILLKDGLLLTACYLDLFELLREEMPTETAIMRVSRQETSSYFNPLLPGDPLMQVPEDQFEFCMGLLKLIAGPKLATPANEMALRKRLAEFFNAHEKCIFSSVSSALPTGWPRPTSSALPVPRSGATTIVSPGGVRLITQPSFMPRSAAQRRHLRV